MTRVARVQAQAKINLVLQVGALEASGFHPVFTILQRLDLADDVTVRVGGTDRSLDCAGPMLPYGGLGADEANLAYRAAVAYAARVDWLKGFAIEVTKNIPVGAGLGGGSADAGAVLRALEALAPRSIGFDALDAIAASLGSDVPFLTSDYVTAVGIGRGEKLGALGPETFPPKDVLLVVPSFGVSTRDAYRWLDEAKQNSLERSTVSGGYAVVGSYGLDSWERLKARSRNDFEGPVEARHPELRRYRERLTGAGAIIARLAGSGSSVFGVFDGAAPDPDQLSIDARVLRTRTSSQVVQVEVLE